MVAFHFDRAVWLFGATLDGELNKAGQAHKKPKMAEAAKARVMAKWMGNDGGFRKPVPTRE